MRTAVKKLLALILSVSVLSAVCCVDVLAAENVLTHEWARGDVAQAQAEGIVPEGLPGDYTEPITRAQFCLIAVRLYENAVGKEIQGRTTFDDTTDTAVEKMAYLGVVTGTGNGLFVPDGILDREQAATILARLAAAIGEPLPEGQATFDDRASISTWALDATGQMQAAGIMSGDETGAFRPQDVYTIEQSLITALRTKTVLESGSTVLNVASGTCGDDITWTLDNTGTLTLSGTGAMDAYSYQDLPWLFWADQISRVVVEEGVTRLCAYAFYGHTELASVSLPDSLKELPENLFLGCSSLTEIWIPAGVTSIPRSAFVNCTALESIDVDPRNSAFSSEDGVLFDEDGATLLIYPSAKTDASYRIPEGVTAVDSGAFQNNDFLTALTIPTSMVYGEDSYYSFGRGITVRDCDGLTDIYCLNDVFQAVALTAGNLVGRDEDEQVLYWRPSGAGQDVAVHYQSDGATVEYTFTNLSQIRQLTADQSLCQWPTHLVIYAPLGEGGEYAAEMVDSYWPGLNYRVESRSLRSLGCDLLYCTFDYGDGMELLPYARGYLDELSEDSVELLQRARRVLSEILTPDMGEYEQVKAIHDYLVNNTDYVLTASRAHSPEGPILDGQAVCEGYAKAFVLLCDMCGIDSFIVTGVAEGGDHGWNKVKVDGVWYNMDVTWDDPVSSRPILRYDYFLVSDATLAEDHSWDNTDLPFCAVDYARGHWIEP